MASLNQVTLIGNLTKDPELRFTPNGAAVCALRLATNRKWKDKATETWKEEVTYITADAWGKQAEACGEHLKKGAPVLIEGRLTLKEWEKDGQKRSILEVTAERVQFLSGKKDAEAHAEDGVPF
jgi:single-strand DNA-binding protein